MASYKFYLSQSEINFIIITAESNFGIRTGETIHFAENIFIFTSLPQFSLNKFTRFTKPIGQSNRGNLLINGYKIIPVNDYARLSAIPLQENIFAVV